MKKNFSLSIFFVFLVIFSNTALADYKIRQQVSMGTGKDTFTQERAIWVKDARERTETKFVTDDPQAAAMMPQIAEVRQCDLRQTIKINDRSKKYYLDPFYESDNKPLPSVQPTTKTEIVKGGTVTWTYTLTDTGERRQMFGFTARHLIIKQVMESSKDACQGESKMNTEEDGWFVYLIPEAAKCMIDLPRGESKARKECRDKLIAKGNFKYPGMMLEGTTKMNDLLRKYEMNSSIKTLDLSKATLEMSLFDIPAGYTEVNSEQSLMSFNMSSINTGGVFDSSGSRTSNKKTVAIDFFSGNVSKINQASVRQYLAQKVSGSKIEGVVVMSQNDISSGAFSKILGVEIKSAKESGASKIGGLFGKVTGNDDAAKLGKSEAEVIITLYDKDGKTVVGSASAKEKTDGKADDAVKAALDKALMQIMPKL